MGSCTYYLKAKFESRKKCLAAARKFRDFIKESHSAFEFHDNNFSVLEPGEFWLLFRNKFPLVMKFVESYVNPKQLVFGLSGTISFTADGDSYRKIKIHDDEGDELWYAECVWHGAQWQPLCDWLVKEFGAEMASFITEDDIDVEIDPFFFVWAKKKNGRIPIANYLCPLQGYCVPRGRVIPAEPSSKTGCLVSYRCIAVPGRTR